MYALEARIVGRLGPGPRPSVVVVPPGPGSSASAVLQVTDGAAYCAGFGGAAGGRVSNKGAVSFKISNPTAEACP